jgi:CRISPR/Cas system-associated exonuclease Cas4 (RecB family)
MKIRTSSLPKLASQPCYEPSSEPASDAAARGTLLDAAWRAEITGCPPTAAIPTEDRSALDWAVETTKLIAGDSLIIADEMGCRLKVPIINYFGTADAIIPDKNIVIDLKTGQIRGDYKYQLAAYALACMDKYFEERWTGVLVYCDQQESIHYDFTYAEAFEIVSIIVSAAAKARELDKRTTGDYCGWCGRRDSCPALVQPCTELSNVVKSTSSTATLTALRDKILSSPESAGEFLAKFKIFEKEVAEPVDKMVRGMLRDGGLVPGWQLKYAAGTTVYPTEAIERVAEQMQCSARTLIEVMGGKLTEKKMNEFCGALGCEAPRDLAIQGAQVERLTQTKPKKEK